LAVAADSVIQIYETKNYEIKKELNGHSTTILAIDINAKNDLMVSAGRDSTIFLWDLDKLTVLAKFRYHKAAITSIIILKNLIISGGTDNQILIYDRITNKILHVLNKHSHHVLDLALHPDDTTLASSGADGKIVIWDIKTGEARNEIITDSWIRGVAFKTDRTQLIYCTDKGKVIEWNNERKELINKHRQGFDWLTTVNYTTDGRAFVSGNIKGSIRIKHAFGKYRFKIKAPIMKTIFKPDETLYIKIAVGTLGNGAFVIDGRNMKGKER
jgi:WD40 repeat protein